MIQINKETANLLKGVFFNDFYGNEFLLSNGIIFEILQEEDGKNENNKRPINELV